MSSNISFKVYTSLSDYQSIYWLISLLNKDLTENDFMQYAQAMHEDANYTLHAIYSNEELAGVCGCWITTKFYTGKYLEIDNFIIAPKYRKLGLGAAFVKYVEELAQDAQCKIIMLDAYLENKAAHAFYESHGFVAKGYHFLKEVIG